MSGTHPALSGFLASYLQVGDTTRYLVPGKRVTIGKCKTSDIVIDGPGVQFKHARISLHENGQLYIKPMGGAAVRIGLERIVRPHTATPGETLGIGLHLVETGVPEHPSYVHAVMLGHELQRKLGSFARFSPWLLISLLINALFALLLLFLNTQQPETPAEATMAVGQLTTPYDGEDLAQEIIDDMPREDLSEAPPLEDFDIKDQAEDEPMSDLVAGVGDADDTLLASSILAGTNIGDGKSKHGAPLKGLNGNFKKTVTQYRERGLEIALLFDSTGSMGGTLAEAKRSLRGILEELQELVPGTRVALITYRDNDANYVTRNTRLGTDHFEALAFLSSVQAAEGGDFPEAVDAAMDIALRMHWQPRSYKAIVVVGDAPPHQGKGSKRAIRLARSFRRKGGKVHFLLARQAEETIHAMLPIVKAGGGRILELQEPAELARTILTLTFGDSASRDLKKRLADRSRTGARAPRAGRGARTLPPVQTLAQNLRRRHPDPDVVEAWASAPPARLADMARGLRSVRLSREGTQAAHYIVNTVVGRYPYLPLTQPELGKKAARGLPKDIQRVVDSVH